MKKLWKKFDGLTAQCYSDMIQGVPEMTNWDACFHTLLDIIKQGREQNPDYAKELYQLDDETEFSHDVDGWLEDYLGELDIRGSNEELEQVCRKLIELFDWKEDSPSELCFFISSALGNQGKHKEALEYCEEWYARETDNITAAAALVYSRIAVKEWDKAEQIIKKYIDDDMVCTEENDIIYTAAELLYKANGNKKAEKKVSKAIKEYEKRLEEYFMGMDDDLDYDDLPFN